jgi:subtilisin family serine protease
MAKKRAGKTVMNAEGKGERSAEIFDPGSKTVPLNANDTSSLIGPLFGGFFTGISMSGGVSVGPLNFGDPEGHTSSREYFDDRLLVLVNPDITTRPSDKYPMGLPATVTKALLALIPLGLAKIQPILHSGFRFWHHAAVPAPAPPGGIAVGVRPEGLTNQETILLSQLISHAIIPASMLAHSLTALPLEAAREMASRIELIFSRGARIEAAADQLRRGANIVRVEKSVRGFTPSVQVQPVKAAIPIASAAREIRPGKLDWWRTTTRWNEANQLMEKAQQNENKTKVEEVSKGEQTSKESVDNSNSPAKALSLAKAAVNNIAVLDSGADQLHPVFQNAVRQPDPAYFPFPSDDTYGHGTHVCSIIAGRETPNATAVSAPAIPDGVLPKSTILIFNIFTDGATTVDMRKFKTALFAIRWAHPEVRVINLSIWMSVRPDQDLLEEFDKMEALGIVIVACSGNQFDTVPGKPLTDLFNDGSFRVQFPARLRRILSVAALNSAPARADFSRFSTWGTNGDDGNDYSAWTEGRWPLVDVSAPGESICGAVPMRKRSDKTAMKFFDSDTGAVLLRGTSMATPMVTAAAGYLLAQPNWQGASAFEVRQAIRKCFHNEGVSQWTDSKVGSEELYGAGVLDFSKIVQVGIDGPPVSKYDWTEMEAKR